MASYWPEFPEKTALGDGSHCGNLPRWEGLLMTGEGGDSDQQYHKGHSVASYALQAVGNSSLSLSWYLLQVLPQDLT